MMRTLLSLLLLAGLSAGCSLSAACDAETDSLECYCADNPENCTDESEAITNSTPDDIATL
ncbi:MAG: hypothetical protein AAF170_00985 [Bacteroidota bacterium]